MKNLSLVIPVYNEAKRLNKTISTLKKGFSFHGLKFQEIIFVDDGSTDNTFELLKSHQAELEKMLKLKVILISYAENKGRGYALRLACLAANGDYVLYTDADFSIPLSNLPKFIPYMKQGYGLIIGSKKKPGAEELIRRSWLRRIVGFGHSLIASVILGVFAWDFQGGFKIFSRQFVSEVMSQAKMERWGLDMEVIFLAKMLGFCWAELPVSWSHVETDSKVKLLRDITRSLKDIFAIKGNWLMGRYGVGALPKLVLAR